ncbi:Hypothetical protein BN69_3525 [Methylocystis sp. SC2]|nr:Hypothetical protein BN69_3525 [Methylocystis sp. SC2]
MNKAHNLLADGSFLESIANFPGRRPAQTPDAPTRPARADSQAELFSKTLSVGCTRRVSCHLPSS